MIDHISEACHVGGYALLLVGAILVVVSKKPERPAAKADVPEARQLDPKDNSPA